MSERYADCPSCKGMGFKISNNELGQPEKHDCAMCDGTGFSGSIEFYGKGN